AVAEPRAELEVPHRTDVPEDVPQNMAVGHHAPLGQRRAAPCRGQRDGLAEPENVVDLLDRRGLDGDHRVVTPSGTGRQLIVAGWTTKQPTESALPLEVTCSWIQPASRWYQSASVAKYFTTGRS